MIRRIALAVVIGAIAWLLCVIGGALLASVGIPVVKTLGDLLEMYAVVIGVLVGLVAFFTGWSPI